MPNWCSNILHVTAPVQLIKAMAKGADEGRLFQTVVPMPLALLNTVSGNLADKKQNEANQRKIQQNIEKYGAGTWHDFAVQNWGTKWDCGTCHTFDIYDSNGKTITLDDLINNNLGSDFNAESPLTLHLGFDTAWSPPTGVYDELAEMEDVTVEAYYFEPGMAFVGEYTSDGGDVSYSIPSEVEDVEKEIPAHLDEMFCISENMAMWEEEELDGFGM